jgi:hypothetical protein
MPIAHPESRGKLLAAILAGSWRESSAGSLEISEAQLDIATPLIDGSGAGPLGWWRIRQCELRQSPSGEVLHQAFRLAALQAKIHEAKIRKAFRLLRAAGVEPILFKGWSIARFYPNPALRPSGDIDVLVSAGDYGKAKSVAESDEARDCWLDLHTRISELDDRSIEDLCLRSELVSCGDEQVRVLAAEDHFALLAIHLLKHGAWRPLWLCDIAVLAESLGDDFDWGLCLGSSRRRQNWILSVIGLARVLLGAAVDSGRARNEKKLPGWLLDSVLKQWSNLYPGDHLPIQAPPLMVNNLRSPRALIKGILERWPDPVTATFNLKSTINSFPRLPYQLAAFAFQAVHFLIRLPGSKAKLTLPPHQHENI